MAENTGYKIQYGSKQQIQNWDMKHKIKDYIYLNFGPEEWAYLILHRLATRQNMF